MSSMTESLLLHAQTLVSTGECSASIDTLRVVIAQCTSDIKNCEEEGRGEVDVADDTARRTARRMRNTASHLLSTLLLQRSGRRKQERRDSCRRMRAAQDIDEYDDYYCCNEDEDECEADALLRTKLGYQLRISTMAFGYPPCGCSSSCSKFKSSLPSPVLNHDNIHKHKALSSILDSSSAMFQRTTIIDNVLPPLLLFQKLQHAFRPKSKYWSEFYHPHETNMFASHNIPLPPTNTSNYCTASSSPPPSSSSSMLLDQHLYQSKSLEQVAILIQQQLIQYFPDIIHATSVEIWCHARSQDEGHRLHYDMDEILLWLERCRKQQQQQQQTQQQPPQQEQSRKRPKIHLPPPAVKNEFAGQITTTTPASGESPSSSLLLVKSNQLVENEDTENDNTDDGISCPIVSCVLTLYVPNGTKCQTCGKSSNCAPTIVCDQSILKRRNRQSCCAAATMSSSNVGYLCFPKVNRLLAFEGSLLHGVIPGIPTVQRQSAGSSSSMSSDDDDDDDSYDNKDDGKSYHERQRITMMLGFWTNVCTTKSTIIGDNTTSSSSIGPNVLYETQKGSWKEDFRPISISKEDLDGIMKSCIATSNKSNSNLVVIDPLWIPIHPGNTVEEEEEKKISDNTIGKCSFYNGNSSSRFFLQSNSPCGIDNEVLCGI